jgi:hypothetical protein
VSTERTSAFRALAAGGDATIRAAVEIRSHDDWMGGDPPRELLAAATLPECDPESPVVALIREWEREPMGRALVAAYEGERDPRTKERTAWLIKQAPEPTLWPELRALAASESGPVLARRYIIEALDRLAFGRVIGEPELAPLIEHLQHHREPSLREATAGLLMSLPDSPSKTDALIRLLSDSDGGVICVAAAALRHTTVGRERILRRRIDELLWHPNAAVRGYAQDLAASLDEG